MHSQVAAHWIRIDMHFVAEKYKKTCVIVSETNSSH
jgi:hypothetical protein